jgi:hypothetical protein
LEGVDRHIFTRITVHPFRPEMVKPKGVVIRASLSLPPRRFSLQKQWRRLKLDGNRAFPVTP